MSYCRFSDSDCYVFDHVCGGFVCMSCRLEPEPERPSCTCDADAIRRAPDTLTAFSIMGACGAHRPRATWSCSRRSELIAHLREHEAAGHSTGDAIPTLEDELPSLGDEWRDDG